MSKDKTLCWKNDLLFKFPFRDKMFPAFGFGAQIPPQWQVRGARPAVLPLGGVTPTHQPPFSAGVA